jgi:prepilin-type processing-associated H-X9-DG protein
MKSHSTKLRNWAMTQTDVLVIVLIVTLIFAFLLALLLPVLAASKRRSSRINCISNIKQVNLAFRIWEGDNNNFYPMGVSVTNGGGREAVITGNLFACFRAASNEMSTTKILVCPDDPNRTYASNFDALDRSHISYFLGADVTDEAKPNLILDGDDDLELSGSPVKSGLLELSSNAPISWTTKRHSFGGNIGFADGSVAKESSSDLRQALQNTGLSTNRLAIP